MCKAVNPSSQYHVQFFQRSIGDDVDRRPFDLGIVTRVQDSLHDFRYFDHTFEEPMAMKGTAIGGYVNPARDMITWEGTFFVRRILEARPLGLGINSPDVYYRLYAGAAINLRKSYNFAVSTQLKSNVRDGVKSVAARYSGSELLPSVFVFGHDLNEYPKDEFSHNMPLHLETSSKIYGLIKYNMRADGAHTYFLTVNRRPLQLLCGDGTLPVNVKRDVIVELIRQYYKFHSTDSQALPHFFLAHHMNVFRHERNPWIGMVRYGTNEGITSYLTIVPGQEATVINICESEGRSRTEGLKLEHSKLSSNIANIIRKQRIEKIDVFNIETNDRHQSEHTQKLFDDRKWHMPKRTGFEKQATFFYQSDVLIEDLRSPLNLQDSLVELPYVDNGFIEAHLSYKNGHGGIKTLVSDLFDWVWKRNIIQFDSPIQAAAFIRGCLPEIAQLELVEDRSLVFLKRDVIIPPLKDADSVSAPPDGGSMILKMVVGENAEQNIGGIHDETKIHVQHFFNDLRNGRRLFSTTIVLISEAQNEITFC